MSFPQRRTGDPRITSVNPYRDEVTAAMKEPGVLISRIDWVKH